MNTCKTCKHWVPYKPRFSGDSPKSSGGLCNSPKITEDWDGKYQADMLVYRYPEGGDFWTGPEFGCVHHEVKT